jgi:membrane peptidoglycan carboxypeptidase
MKTFLSKPDESQKGFDFSSYLTSHLSYSAELDQSSHLLHNLQLGIGTRIETRLCYSSKINPSAKLAVMASEDQLFPDHNGFDVEEH